jgi:hypothetical protein
MAYDAQQRNAGTIAVSLVKGNNTAYSMQHGNDNESRRWGRGALIRGRPPGNAGSEEAN